MDLLSYKFILSQIFALLIPVKDLERLAKKVRLNKNE
tara:strand:- start:265 stop:375 length:111 start_codon:yes stop_codon:yes gene_type:complete